VISGAYHCLFAPDGSVNLADFLTPLISWVNAGKAPGAVPADTYSTTQNAVTAHQTVAPYNALKPVHPVRGGLNSRYRYIGTYAHHQ
jgi:hypothetical protein